MALFPDFCFYLFILYLTGVFAGPAPDIAAPAPHGTRYALQAGEVAHPFRHAPPPRRPQAVRVFPSFFDTFFKTDFALPMVRTNRELVQTSHAVFVQKILAKLHNLPQKQKHALADLPPLLQQHSAIMAVPAIGAPRNFSPSPVKSPPSPSKPRAPPATPVNTTTTAAVANDMSSRKRSAAMAASANASDGTSAGSAAAVNSSATGGSSGDGHVPASKRRRLVCSWYLFYFG
jgi:hypothetical protein